jgi:hypothetical protein
VLISRSELRLAITAGLGNALAALSGLPFGYYVPLAVLAIGTGSYGSSLGLGRQRILGSLLGSALLVVGLVGLAGLPMPLGLALTLASLRLLGGALGLRVGYKVGGIIVVMGWLVHGGQLDRWIGLRLGWTCFGVALGLLSLRLFWPGRAVAEVFRGTGVLLAEVRGLYEELADRVDPTTPAAAAPAAAPGGAPFDDRRYRELRARLLALRRERPSLEEELGSQPQRHPADRLIRALDQACARLVHASGAISRRPPPFGSDTLLQRLHRAEADLLRTLAARLALWQRQLAEPGRPVPTPPHEPFALPPSWLRLEQDLQDPALAEAELAALVRLASRLMLCRLAHQAMVETERQWGCLVVRCG